jgi:predicted nucleic acid-binding protein
VRTAIDSNVLSALWSAESIASHAEQSLGNAKLEGGLVISAPVYAELLAHPKVTQSDVNDFLEETAIEVDFELSRDVWLETARRFALYAKRRRRTSRETPKRLLADFLIGSHALTQADRLMTLDAQRYKRDFPELTLVTVSA